VGLAEIHPAFYYPEQMHPIWINPVTGVISSPAGIRDNPVTGNQEFHDGVDIAIPIGTSIVAPRDGEVIAAGFSPSYGWFLRLSHDDEYITFFAHLSNISVSIGDRVHQGHHVAYSGNTGMSTGPHLHFSIFQNGQFVDPIARLDFQP